MHRKIVLAIGLALALAAPCSALTTIFGGNHVFYTAGESTFPIIATSDSGEGIAAVDVFLLMEPSGPLITKIDVINGTVFETNNQGQFAFGGPQFRTPGYEPAYYTTTNFGTVPTGVVGWVTVDFTGIAPGVYNLSLENPVGPSAVYDMFGVPGIYVNGTVTLVPEPSSIMLGLFAAASLGAIALRRRRRS